VRGCWPPEVAHVLKHAAGASPPAAARLVLIAPTWRGPLPTLMGGHRPFFERLCRLVDRPGLGPLIYRLNVNPFVVRRMGAGPSARIARAPNPMRSSGRRPQRRACRPTQGANRATTICGRVINAATISEERLSPS
jgi:hypothetical protein